VTHAGKLVLFCLVMGTIIIAAERPRIVRAWVRLRRRWRSLKPRPLLNRGRQPATPMALWLAAASMAG